jgi:hypothetical protein
VPVGTVAQDPQPLIGYPWWVTTLGVTALVLAAAAVVFVWWWTRPTQPRYAIDTDAAPGPTRPWWRGPLSAAQYACLAQIVDLSRRYEAGRADSRAVHLELASIIRRYASTRLDRDVLTLTASELRRLTGDSPAALALRAWLPPSFDGPQAAPGTTRQSITAAWEVVQRW